MKNNDKLALILITVAFTIIILLLVFILLRTYGILPSVHRVTDTTTSSSTTASQTASKTISSTSKRTTTNIRLVNQVFSDNKTSKYEYDKTSKTMYVSDLLEFLIDDNAINDAFNAYTDTLAETSYADYLDFIPWFLPFNKHVIDGTIHRFVDGDYITTINLGKQGEIESADCSYQGAGYATITYDYSEEYITISNSLSGDSRTIKRQPDYSFLDIRLDESGKVTVLQFDSPGGLVTMQYSYNEFGEVESLKYVSDYYSYTKTYAYKDY